MLQSIGVEISIIKELGSVLLCSSINSFRHTSSDIQTINK
jgi:hypothetical protein